MRYPCLVFAVAASFGGFASATLGALLPQLFQRVPTGAVKPSGWAMNQAQIQVDGLGGHLMDFDSYVAGSIWVGGPIEYSEMHESAPYWFNAMVSLAFQTQDQRLLGQVKSFMDYTLDRQGDDGWLGPEPFVANATLPRLVWPRYLFLFGLIQYAEADPTETTRIVDAMHRFLALVHTIWQNNEEGDQSLGFQYAYQYVRWEELIYSLQWMYDNFPNGQEAVLLETMQLVRDSGFSWKNDWFTEAIFPKVAVTDFTNQNHGVNIGEALKSEALAYRFTGDPTDVQSTFDRIDMLYQYHGRASGTFSADEHLAGLNPSRGTETCAVVEQMFSLAIIYQTFGNNSVADRVEKLAYNALPAATMPDWKSHQYDQEANQIWAQNIDPPPWGDNGPNSNVFGFEPNYPCCTVNHPQGYPKFWANSFFTEQGGASLIHAFLGPATFSGTLATQNNVKVTVDTLYPFGSTLTYSISATKSFAFNIRIPTWAQNNLSTIATNNGKAAPLSLNASTSFQTIQIPGGKATTLHLFLNMPLEIETRTNGAIAVTRGPLNYAVEISYNVTTALGLRSTQALAAIEVLYPDAPAAYLTPFDNHTQDNTLLPTSEWRLAIDPNTIEVKDNSASQSTIPFYAWATGAQPVTMTASACQINWGLAEGIAAVPPPSPNTCVGPVIKVNLAPFGAAKLRLGEIPTMSVS